MQGSRQIVRGKVMQVSDSRWLEGHARFKATVRWKVVQGSRQQSAGRSCKVQGSSSLEGHARFKATVRCNSSPLVVLCRSRWRGVLVRSLRRRQLRRMQVLYRLGHAAAMHLEGCIIFRAPMIEARSRAWFTCWALWSCTLLSSPSEPTVLGPPHSWKILL